MHSAHQALNTQNISCIAEPQISTACLLAYKKQFVLRHLLPRILMQAIRLLPPRRSDNYQKSYIISVPVLSFLTSSPSFLVYVCSTADIHPSGTAEQQCTGGQRSAHPGHTEPTLTPHPWGNRDEHPLSGSPASPNTPTLHRRATEERTGYSSNWTLSKAPIHSHLKRKIRTMQHKEQVGRI